LSSLTVSGGTPNIVSFAPGLITEGGGQDARATVARASRPEHFGIIYAELTAMGLQTSKSLILRLPVALALTRGQEF
jgi:hypothetical protein